MRRWVCPAVTFVLLYGASVNAANNVPRDARVMPVGSLNLSESLRFGLFGDFTQQLKDHISQFPLLGQSKSCKFCSSKRKCGSLKDTGRRLSKCHTIRGHFRELASRNFLLAGKRRYGYPDVLLFYCWKSYCKKFRPSEYCGLQPSGRKPRMSDLDKEIKAIDAEVKVLTKRFYKEVAPRFRFSDYRKRRDVVVKLQAQAKKNLNTVLNARKRNYELKKKLRSLKFRKQLFNVNQYGNETLAFKTRIFYWTKLEASLRKALRTSSLQVKKLLSNVKDDVRDFHKEADLARRYRKNVKNFDKRFKVLSDQQESLEDRIERVSQQIAGIDTDYELFKKVGSRISRLLESLTKKISKGDLKIDCGNEALAVAIADFTT